MLRVVNEPNIPTSNLAWEPAVKTKGMFAMSIVKLFSDSTMIKHFTLQTLEGPQQVKEDMTICIGTAKTDPWMQSMKNILEKYVLESVTPDGWMYFIPKPGIVINCYQVTEKDVQGYDGPYFQIYASYGHEVYPNGEKKYLQTGTVGDYICNKPDTDDIWVVKQALFESTYEVLKPILE